MKPIKDAMNQPFIGRTIIKTYPPDVNGNRRVFVTSRYNVSLFGFPLAIESLPFQTQDEGVSKCATIALWSALQPLIDTFDIIRHSPAEITEVSTSFPTLARKYPSQGLAWEQMAEYIRSLGLDIEPIDAQYENEDTIQTAIMLYVNAGYPLIAALQIYKGSGEFDGRHAAVISGYRQDNNGNLKEIYVHDDQICPYCKTLPSPDFKNWYNEWSKDGKKVELEKLMIPIYPKLRLTFVRMYTEYTEILKRGFSNFDRPIDNLKLHLTTVNEYKEFLLTKSIKEKENILFASLPRFIWIVRGYHQNNPVEDILYDGTSVYARMLNYHVEFT